MNNTIKVTVSWAIAAWMCYVFLGSLPYKFTGAPDTLYIFGTIGGWLGTFLGETIGSLFTNYGAYLVGAFELIVALILLSPIVLGNREKFHYIGGLMASVVMAGAVFFHAVSPLGWAVLHEGKSDGGSLANAALSILILGIVMAWLNKKPN